MRCDPMRTPPPLTRRAAPRARSLLRGVCVKALEGLLASLATLAVTSRVASIASKPASSGFDCKLYAADAQRENKETPNQTVTLFHVFQAS